MRWFISNHSGIYNHKHEYNLLKSDTCQEKTHETKLDLEVILLRNFLDLKYDTPSIKNKSKTNGCKDQSRRKYCLLSQWPM